MIPKLNSRTQSDAEGSMSLGEAYLKKSVEGLIIVASFVSVIFASRYVGELWEKHFSTLNNNPPEGGN